MLRHYGDAPRAVVQSRTAPGLSPHALRRRSPQSSAACSSASLPPTPKPPASRQRRCGTSCSRTFPATCAISCTWQRLPSSGRSRQRCTAKRAPLHCRCASLEVLDWLLLPSAACEPPAPVHSEATTLALQLCLSLLLRSPVSVSCFGLLFRSLVSVSCFGLLCRSIVRDTGVCLLLEVCPDHQSAQAMQLDCRNTYPNPSACHGARLPVWQVV